MKRTLTLIFHFYKPIGVICILFTLLSTFSFIKLGLEFLNIPILLKLLGYGVVVGYQYFFSAKSFFYFRNAGYSARRMYGYVFSIDFGFYLLLMTLTYIIIK